MPNISLWGLYGTDVPGVAGNCTTWTGVDVGCVVCCTTGVCATVCCTLAVWTVLVWKTLDWVTTGCARAFDACELK